MTNEIVEVPLNSSLGPVTRTIDFGGKGQKDIYQAAIGFDVNIPMLRGRGADAVAARENAAIKDFEAAELAVTHSAAEAVFRRRTPTGSCSPPSSGSTSWPGRSSSSASSWR